MAHAEANATASPAKGHAVPLHRLAHARAGDKGDRLNLALFAFEPRHYDTLVAQVTEERVLALFAHRGASRVRRYLMPGLPA